MTERLIATRGITLCAKSFGDAKNPTLLLIMGACASMIWWPQDFCEKLAKAGFYVIRFDHRDTGLSTFYEPGTIHYSLDDMMEDAVAILDAYEQPVATVVGASLGGMIAQLLALKHPERMQRLVLLISGPVAVDPDVALPPIEQKVLNHHANAGSIDWSSEKIAVDFMVDGWRVTAGTRHPFDERLMQSLAAEEFHRSKSLLSMFNHALLSGGEWAAGKLKSIRAPTLIFHGTDDPVLPFPHAEYLAHEIPKSQLVSLKGAGHEIHRQDWDLIVRMLQT